MAFNLSQQMKEILTDYTDDIAEAIEEIISDVAEDASSKLKETSPVRTGKYSKGWKADTTKRRTYTEAVVSNKRYQLTHLLENGHAKRNGGRVEARPHIFQINEWSQEEAVRRILKAIEGIK